MIRTWQRVTTRRERLQFHPFRGYANQHGHIKIDRTYKSGTDNSPNEGLPTGLTLARELVGAFIIVVGVMLAVLIFSL